MADFILQRQNPWWETGKINFQLFPRILEKELIKNLENEKIIALVGSRQVGKTSLLYLLIENLLKTNKPANILYFNLDDITIQTLFETPEKFLQYIQIKNEKKYIFIDEIQRLRDPGLFLKAIHDLKLNLKIIVSGSSQLELRSKLKEFLVGRIRQFEIPRLLFQEVCNLNVNIPKKNILNETLLYGTYPEIAKQKNIEEKKLLLNDIYQTYLQKDVSDFAKIEDIETFNKLLIILSSQIGGLLNTHSIAKTLRLTSHKIEKYIDILEGTFIIKRIYPFFQNYKKEITKTPKIYFLDLGLRNLLLANWQPIELREDKGKIFENFIFLELYNSDIYKQCRFHYWRTTNQTEIDFIKDKNSNLMAIETKFGENKKSPKSFSTFKKYYPESITKIMTPDTYLEPVQDLSFVAKSSYFERKT